MVRLLWHRLHQKRLMTKPKNIVEIVQVGKKTNISNKIINSNNSFFCFGWKFVLCPVYE